MAVNTQKFLPSSGGAIVKGVVPKTSLVPYSPQGKFAMPEVAEEKTKVDKPGLDENVEAIRESTTKIKAVLRKSVKIDLKQFKDNRKRQERDKRSGREDKLESKEDTKKEKKGLGISAPKVPFFTRVKNFLGSIFLGWLGIRLIKFAPQFSAFLDAIKPVAVWIEGFIGDAFNGFVGFIDGAYDINTKVENKVEELFGDEGLKKFKEFQSTFTKFMNLAIIAGMMSSGGSDLGLGRRRGGGSRSSRTGIQGMRNQAGRVTRGGTTASAARRFADRYGRDAAIKRFGPEAVQSLGGKYARSAATNTARRTAVALLGKGGTRASLRVLKNFIQPVVKRIPLIGGLIDFALNYFVFKEPIGRAAFAAIGSTIFGALGAGAGSIVPVVGNIVGAALGGLAGDMAGKWLYDTFFDKKKPVDVPEGTEGRERGGEIGKSEDDEEKLRKERERDNQRRVNKFRVTPNPKVSEDPSADKKNLFERVFGNLKKKGGAFEFLTKARQKISDGRTSMISKIMTLGIDILSGKTVSNKTIQDIAKNMVNFFDAALPAPLNMLRQIIQKFSGGGLVQKYSPIERDRRVRDTVRQLQQGFARDIMEKQRKIFGTLKRSSIAAGVRDAALNTANDLSLGGGDSRRPTAAGRTLAADDKLIALTGSSGSVRYDGQSGAKLDISYSPFAKSDIEAQEPLGGIVITSGKGMRGGRQHNGYDIGASFDTPMYAYLDGEVTHVNTQLGGPKDGAYGYWIVWKDAVHGAYHFFGHLNRPPGLKVGDKFKAGALLANVGGSGNGSLRMYDPHLHWEISKSAPQTNGQFTSYVDPGDWVNTYGATPKEPVIGSLPKSDADAITDQAEYEKSGTEIVIVQNETVRTRVVTRHASNTPSLTNRKSRDVLPTTAIG